MVVITELWSGKFMVHVSEWKVGWNSKRY